MKKSLAIIKLGGSAVTDKTKFKTVRRNVIKGIAPILKRYHDKIGKMIIVHGGGSFGHPIAKKYNIDKGLTESNKIGLSETVDAMRELSLEISTIFRNFGLPIFPVQPSSFFITKNGEIINDSNLIVIREALKHNLIPMLWGDAVFDISIGCSILSGDKIILHLAKKLRPNVVVFGSDVEGIFINKNGIRQLVRKITNKNFNEILKSISLSSQIIDVTGGIISKIMIMREIAKLGIKTCLVSLFDPENLYKALVGEDFVGTLFDRLK